MAGEWNAQQQNEYSNAQHDAQGGILKEIKRIVSAPTGATNAAAVRDLAQALASLREH